ncbi:MAG: septum formation family protein, partial [Acidimicrobiales bacterium]
VTLVPCLQEHTDEVFAVVGIEAAPGARYPARIDDLADGLCREAFVTFVGQDPQRSVLTYDWYTPTEAEWGAGGRQVACVATAP